MKLTGTPAALDAKALRAEVLSALESAADERTRIKLQRVIPGARTLGVTVPKIRALAASFYGKRHAQLEAACALLDEQCKERCREEILFGTFLVARYRKELPTVTWSRAERWAQSIDNWETCDQLAMNVVGEIVARELSLVSKLEAWTKSENRWLRRFAVACTTALNQKGRCHPDETFRVCAHVLSDPEPMVQKAVAWAIRKVCDKNATAGFAFLRQQAKKMSPKLLREAAQKLSAAHRASLLRDGG